MGPWESQNTVKRAFRQRVATSVSFKKVMTCDSIARSAICFLVHNDEARLHLPSDDAIQEAGPFAVVPLQESGADELALTPKLFCHIFGYQPCGNFAEPKTVKH